MQVFRQTEPLYLRNHEPETVYMNIKLAKEWEHD
jgi:hypothetical protein